MRDVSNHCEGDVPYSSPLQYMMYGCIMYVTFTMVLVAHWCEMYWTCINELQTPSQRWHASPSQWYVQFIGQDIWCMLCMQCTPTWRPLEYGWSGLLKGSWNVWQKMGVWMPHSDCFVQFRGSLPQIGPFGEWSRMLSYICWKVVVLESFQMALVGTPSW